MVRSSPRPRSPARSNRRERFTREDDLVFAGITGGYLDGSALSKRYRAAIDRAALRRLRFHVR
jgi:hypothetical protein